MSVPVGGEGGGELETTSEYFLPVLMLVAVERGGEATAECVWRMEDV